MLIQLPNTHVLVKLASILLLTIVVRKIDDFLLLLTVCAFAVALIFCRTSHPFRMLKRVRWLILTILLVYAFNTPGEYIGASSSFLWPILPSYEGLHEGFSQVLRLCAVVMALSLLLARTGREVLIGGLYRLFQSLSYLHIACLQQVPERFAVRLWLTLYYVENDMMQLKKSPLEEIQSDKVTSLFKALFDKFDALNTRDHMTESALNSITLQVEPFTWRDYMTLLVLVGLTIYYMCQQ